MTEKDWPPEWAEALNAVDNVVEHVGVEHFEELAQAYEQEEETEAKRAEGNEVMNQAIRSRFRAPTTEEEGEEE